MKATSLAKVTALAISFATAVAFGYVNSARCAYCPSYACYGTCATPDCVCATAPGETAGTCWGVSYSANLKEMGFSIGD